MTRYALTHGRVTLAALLVILVAGVSAYNEMPRAEDPGFIIRTAMVLTYFPGAGPERVEQLVTDKIEQRLLEIPELDSIGSTSKTGVSIVLVNVKESYTDMRPIWDRVRRKVDAVKLPDGVRGPFVNDEFGDVFGVVVGMTADGFEAREMRDIAQQVRRRFLRGSQVAKVDLYGIQEERVFIEYTNARLAELGLSPLALANILESRNIVIPGGSLDVGEERIALEPTGNFESIEDLERTVIQLPSGQLVYLADIAEVRRDYVDPVEEIMTTNGVRSVGLAISMREDGNILELGQFVQDVLRTVAAAYPWGIEFEITGYQPAVVEVAVDDFMSNLFQAVLIVLAVMLLTLGVRTGLVVASLVPSAIVAALLLMSLLDVGINKISLAALIIALGMLVDNAIVMAESVMVQMGEGKPAFDAAVDSARELQVPLLTSSLTTAAAFLPIYLAESAVGEYTGALFTVVTVTLLSSWVLALTLVPMLCVWFLKVKPAPERERPSWAMRAYERVLRLGLRWRWVSVLLAFGLFAVSLKGFAYLPNIFFPPSDRALLTVELDLPPGTRIEHTQAAMKAIEGFIADELMEAEGEPGVKNWSSFVGTGAPRYVLGYNPEPQNPAYGYLFANTTDRDSVDALGARIERFVFENLPDARVVARPLQTGPPVKAPVEYRLSAEADDRLFELAVQTKTKLEAIPGVTAVTDNWGRRAKKLIVDIDQERMRRAGLSNQDIAVSLQTNLSGIETTEYREGDEVIPVVVRARAGDRDDLAKVRGLQVYSSTTGRAVPLSQVADVRVDWDPAQVQRRNQVRTVTVRAQLEGGQTSVSVNEEMGPWLDSQMAELGPAFSYEIGGDVEASVKAQASIAAKLPLAALIIVLLLVAQFNSFRRPTIILMTVPLGIIGVVAGLLMAGSYFGFMTLLGVVSLTGIVINNAIVLIERIDLEIGVNGMEPFEGIVAAARRRVRPILLTTLTTAGGLVPLWLGGGPMFEPMAIAILFGLLFATVLTLGVVPVLYSIFFRVKPA